LFEVDPFLNIFLCYKFGVGFITGYSSCGVGSGIDLPMGRNCV
jgi:hypothetical protein